MSLFLTFIPHRREKQKCWLRYSFENSKQNPQCTKYSKVESEDIHSQSQSPEKNVGRKVFSDRKFLHEEISRVFSEENSKIDDRMKPGILMKLEHCSPSKMKVKNSHLARQGGHLPEYP